MDLSIIIVNYNVRYFLEQCLHAVDKASQGIQSEVFVVDNNSVDGSCSMLAEKFPSVRLIRNDQNLGFSTANNQAIRKASGRYVLLLNPDTVIEEDTLVKCLAYMDANIRTGALGVKMIDGKGHFLPESKRSLPTPTVAFYKIFGFSRLFPRSRLFGRYHLGFLDKEQVHKVEILTGAFMMIRKSALDEVGLLDEDFFMYGEDIDLSYRLINAGYENVYFPETTIIHYKGESTKKGSLNYVRTFYQAMIIFARKHFSIKMARSYALIIHLAIYFRAALSLIRRLAEQLSLPLLQAVTIFAGFWIIKPIWEDYKFQGGTAYPGEYLGIVVPAYITIWLISLFFSGAYDRPVRGGAIARGILTGTLAILVIYALLPESLRFSRALLLMGAAWALISSYVLTLFFHLLPFSPYHIQLPRNKRIVIAGNPEEAARVEGLMRETQSRMNVIGYVDPGKGVAETPAGDTPYIGRINQLEEIVKINRIDEIIFCARDLPAQDIIRYMMVLTQERVDFKIAPPESYSIIGSKSINSAGDLYLIEFETINKPSNRRNKRFFDLMTSLGFLLVFPVLLFWVRHPGRALMNILNVLAGKFSWVGYHPSPGLPELPRIKPGILHPSDALGGEDIKTEMMDQLNVMYLKNYSVFSDAGILLRSIPEIGRRIGEN